MASSPPGYTPNTFEPHWLTLDGDARLDLIARAGSYPPDTGILPILKGLSSFHFSIRTIAGQSLETLVTDIEKKLEFPIDSAMYKEGEGEAVVVGGHLYHTLSPDLPFAEVSLLLSTLFALKDQGAFFAFKALYQRQISAEVMKKVVQEADEYHRLIFVDQYLQSSPEVRLKFAPLFKLILSTIKKRKAVVQFYAWLFDRKRDPDPFLSNIPPVLRDPGVIIDTEVASHSPAEKIIGLKALSMILPKVPSSILAQALANEEVKKMRMAVYLLIENSSMACYPELFDVVFPHFLNADSEEATHAFKAMVVTGKYPPYKIFELIRKTCPEVLPKLLIEISSLDRISFFVIQDMALNKKAYLENNFDVNLACIFGMIKKRPERVIRILKSYEEQNSRSLKIDLTGFMKKTSVLIKKERLSIEKNFKAVSERLKKTAPERSKGIFQAVLKDPLEKKLERLSQGRNGEAVDFSADHIKSQSFAGFNDTGLRPFLSERFLRMLILPGPFCPNLISARPCSSTPI